MTLDNMARQQAEWDARARAAQGSAAQAYARLLKLAETGDSGQIRRVAQFLASTYNGQAFPVDVDISDDMLACLDALRWAKADLHGGLSSNLRKFRWPSYCPARAMRHRRRATYDQTSRRMPSPVLSL